MVFIDNAQILIPALTGIGVTVFKENSSDAPLAQFEKSFCFLQNVQTLYTVDGMLSFFAKKEGDFIYIITDPLDVHTVIIKIEDEWVILGPYVISAWQEHRAKSLLANCGVQDDVLLAYKLYRCELPIIDNEYVIRVAALLLTNTLGNVQYETQTIDMAVQRAEDLPPQIAEPYNDFALTNRRYALEDQIMDAVRQGKTVQALELYEEALALRSGVRFLSNSIADQITGACATRVFIRRAALQAGLTPVYVDALSQEYAQRMQRAVNEDQLCDMMKQYIAVFCHAIRKNNRLDYSPHVKRGINYIEAHLCQPITVETLGRLNNISQQHFTSLFRKEVGMTVKQYIAQERCHLAAELLEHTQLQIQEISHYVGYDDTNYFAKVFKMVFDVTPQDYRKNKVLF